ncbi:MAG: hypothetical protein QM766_26640 [Burkholderiaceae bacterium]
MDATVAAVIATGALLTTIEILDGTRGRESGEGVAARAAAASSGALAAVERMVASAGSGLLADGGQTGRGRQASPLGCRLMAGAQVLTVAPVLVQGGADRFASDSVIAMAGAGATMATPVAVIGDGPVLVKGTRMLRLAAAPGVRPGDRLLVYGQAAGGAPGALCAITRVARLLRAEPAGGDEGAAAANAADASLGGERVVLAEPLPVSVRDAAVVHLGATPQFVRLLVDDAQRLVVEDLLEPSAPRRVLAQAVRGLRVQLGVDADRDGAVDLWLNPADDRADREMAAGRIGALRVGLLGMPFERTTRTRAAGGPGGLGGPGEAGCADDGVVTVLDPVAGLPQAGLPPMPAAAPLAVSPEPSSGDGRQPTAMALATATATATAAATAATATAATAATATAIATATATATATADCGRASVASTVIPLRNATAGRS